MTKGLTLQQFKDGLKKHMEQKGYYGGKYDYLPDTEENRKKKEAYLNWRLNVIFKTNLNTAYQAGRYRQMLRVSDTRPYWVYSAILDNRTRREHALLHGKAFRFDDPFWKTNYPPNGWNCRCTVYSITEDEAKKESVDILSSENGLLDLGINWDKFCEKEWRYNVGETYFSPDWGSYSYLKNYKMKVKEIKNDGTEVEKESTALKYIKQKWVEDLKKCEMNEDEFKYWVNIVKENENKIEKIKRLIGIYKDMKIYIDDKALWHSRHEETKDKRKNKKRIYPDWEDLKNVQDIINNPDKIVEDNEVIIFAKEYDKYNYICAVYDIKYEKIKTIKIINKSKI